MNNKEAYAELADILECMSRDVWNSFIKKYGMADTVKYRKAVTCQCTSIDLSSLQALLDEQIEKGVAHDTVVKTDLGNFMVRTGSSVLSQWGKKAFLVK